ncbi:hypothetical protein [Paraburkholderia flava]|uniref:hypothetical protein n=1 Tax=Paraburkholderia flava TaxID=2547393 RepID=UPI001F0DF465|nr:hypothetical protein [Paraburkholderia flava]
MEECRPGTNDLPLADKPPAQVKVFENSGQSLRYREGSLMKIPGSPERSSQAIFSAALFGSLALEGQPVRFSGIVPGVSMRVGTGSLRLGDDDAVIHAARGIWREVQPRLIEWLTSPVAPAGLKIVLAPDIKIEFGWDGKYFLRPGVTQIDIEYDVAFVAWFTRTRHPLIEVQPKRNPERMAQINIVRSLVATAIQKTVQANDELYARLPPPVRYRATGAVEAWMQVRLAAGESGADFT